MSRVSQFEIVISYFSPFEVRCPSLILVHNERFPIYTLMVSAPDLTSRDAFDKFHCDEVDRNVICNDPYLT